MPENRKYYVHNTTLLVTSRTEEGLPLVATLMLNFIIWGILARARAMYRIRVCHFLFMFNHFHMILVVDDPEHVSKFTGYVKAEIAHAINRLLGRRRKTVWAEGYDSPIILTASDVLRYIEYIYFNPIEANLVDKIDDYPGVSSWSMFLQDLRTVKHKHVKRPLIPELRLPALTINEQKILSATLNELDGQVHEFVLEPFAWMICFPEYANANEEDIKHEIITNLRIKESHFREERKRSRKQVIGATSLRRQSMLKEYQPKKFGRRMICLSSDKNLRKEFIRFYRSICHTARQVYERWKIGEVQLKIPPGLFAPRVPTLLSATCLIT